MKKKLSILMFLMACMSLFLGVNALAASYPSLSESKYCEFTAYKNMSVYKDSAFKTRGTCSPSKSYDALVAKNDICYIYEITQNYVKLSYPVSGGRRIGYIKTSDLLGSNIAPSSKTTAGSKVTTYKYKDGAETGYIAKNDDVYTLSGTYYNRIYTAKSGNRGYKLAYVGTIPPTNGWMYPVKSYSISQSFNHYSKPMAAKGRPYHTGLDMVSSNKTIYAAHDGKIVYKGYSNGNGNHIVLSHNINGTTVKSLYSHLSSYDSCPSVGSSVKKGDIIGIMGSTGNSTGTHLHFGIYIGSSNDPYGYSSESGENIIKYNNCTFYNPTYVVNNNKLPN